MPYLKCLNETLASLLFKGKHKILKTQANKQKFLNFSIYQNFTPIELDNLQSV